MRDKKNIKKLEKALHWTKGGHIVKDAVLALFDLGHLSSVEKFIETANYPSSYDMKCALEEIGAPAIGSWLALIERRYNFVDELAAIGSLSVNPLLSLLSDKLKKNEISSDGFTKDIILSTIKALGKLGDPQAVSILIPLLKDKDSKRSMASLIALGRIRNSTAIEAIINQFTDIILNPSKLSSEAVDIIEKIGVDAIPYLKAAVNSGNKEISKTSQMVLEEIEENPERKKKVKNKSSSNKFTLNVYSLGCPYLKDNACCFRQIAKNQSSEPEKCSLQLDGYKNCHVWAIAPK